MSYIESSVPGYYHAASTTLHTLDRIQDRLCRVLSLSPEVVLERYRLAPLKSRRDMALMGLLHRVVLSDVSRQLAELFPFATSGPLEFVRTRLQIRRHNKQLIAPPFGTETLRRSLFGLVRIYNLLPQSVESVKEFQSTLQGALRHAASLGIPNWDSLFSITTSARFRVPATFRRVAIITAFQMWSCLQNCYLWVGYHSVRQRNRTTLQFSAFLCTSLPHAKRLCMCVFSLLLFDSSPRLALFASMYIFTAQHVLSAFEFRLGEDRAHFNRSNSLG